MARIRVLIAHNHDELLLRILGLLRVEFDIVGAVREGQELILAVDILKPDVIVTEISMPGMGGFDAARLIIEGDPDAKIILLTLHDDPIYVKTGFEAGVRGYVLKTEANEELAQAIHQVYQGKAFVSAKIAGMVFPDPE